MESLNIDMETNHQRALRGVVDKDYRFQFLILYQKWLLMIE